MRNKSDSQRKQERNNLFRLLSCTVIAVFMIISGSGCKEKQTEPPLVVIHYMGWYNDSVSEQAADSLRHWRYGHAAGPAAGLYDSHEEATLAYHILLSHAYGINGIVINVKDSYDYATLRKLNTMVNEISQLAPDGFQYSFGISYDDQGFDLDNNPDTAISALCYLRDSILPASPSFLKIGERPVLFCFDYPNKYLTAGGFRTALDSVFSANRPLLVWNTIEKGNVDSLPVDAYYPWVQPGKEWDRKAGRNWGRDYLEDFYKRVNTSKDSGHFSFTCGGVWPGFDDRPNTSWGAMRFIDRRKGIVYDSTWQFIHTYSGRLPMKLVVVETWNDWNEGTEIEASITDKDYYLRLTEENIARIRSVNPGTSAIRLEACLQILQYGRSIQEKSRITEDQQWIKAVQLYLDQDYKNVIELLGRR